MAVGICAAVVFTLTLFAFLTNMDFTMCGAERCYEWLSVVDCSTILSTGMLNARDPLSIGVL